MTTSPRRRFLPSLLGRAPDEPKLPPESEPPPRRPSQQRKRSQGGDDRAIHDALDGTSGRHVWRLHLRGVPALYVIAQTGEAAVEWLRQQAPDADLSSVTFTDAGSADRTEISLWRDPSTLPNPPADT